ncbi:MAG: hypothetical protein Ct9H90mP5_01000 [Acidimicrobiaceae bacterium]|nr:MAG: hypothetical protein Ct9H90mP5_01000 [Acidimicrobiaceae bacterium]
MVFTTISCRGELGSSFRNSGGCRNLVHSQNATSANCLVCVGGLGAALFGNLTSIPGATLGGLFLGMVASGGVELTTTIGGPQYFLVRASEIHALLFIIIVLYLRGDKLPIRGSISIGDNRVHHHQIMLQLV